MTNQPFDLEVPDPLVLWMHNNNGFVWAGYISGSVAIYFAFLGVPLITLFFAMLSIFSFVLKQIVCGWVHTFAMYCIEAKDDRISVRSKNDRAVGNQ